ncbi:MAG: F0F1 ATP synthase subunit B [Planctomycetota bacterium]
MNALPIRLVALLIAAVLAVAAPVRAADPAPADAVAHTGAAAESHSDSKGGKHETIVQPNALNYFVAIVVFLTSILVLRKFAWPMIIKGLDDREAKILSEIENAERARAEAVQAQQQYVEELAQAKAEATKMIEAAKAEASRAAADLKAQNEAEIGQMRDAARAQITAAQKAAVAELYAQAGILATAVAEKILQREVNEHDQQRLVDETLAEISHEFASAQQPAESHA